MATVLYAVCFRWIAQAETSAAAYAFVLIVHKNRFHGDCLRIMAPGAVHVASLEEDSGSDSRSVIQGESLDICYESLLHVNLVR